jgi:integrase
MQTVPRFPPASLTPSKNKLTDELIAATPTPVSGGKKLFDGAGLFLYVQSRGRPSWRFKYTFGGRESSLSLGAYPEVSIEAARNEAVKARKCILEKRDPAEERRAERHALHIATVTTFKVAAESFLAKDDTLADRTKDKHEWLLSLLKPLHRRPLAAIKASEVLKVLEGISATGKREAARRCGQFVGRVFRHAINRDWYVGVNPAANLRGELPPVVTESHAGITHVGGFGLLMNCVDTPGIGYANVSNGLRLLARTALRPGELRQGLWSEINWARAEWVVPASRMKMRREFLVPLSTQALKILREQQQITGDSPLIFPGVRGGRPMSDAAMGLALKLFIGPDQHVPHGYRVSFSSIANGHGWDSAIVELALSHAKRDHVAGIYDRSQRNPERRALLQWWADSIDAMKAGKPLKRFREDMLGLAAVAS